MKSTVKPCHTLFCWSLLQDCSNTTKIWGLKWLRQSKPIGFTKKFDQCTETSAAPKPRAMNRAAGWGFSFVAAVVSAKAALAPHQPDGRPFPKRSKVLGFHEFGIFCGPTISTNFLSFLFRVCYISILDHHSWPKNLTPLGRWAAEATSPHRTSPARPPRSSSTSLQPKRRSFSSFLVENSQTYLIMAPLLRKLPRLVMTSWKQLCLIYNCRQKGCLYKTKSTFDNSYIIACNTPAWEWSTFKASCAVGSNMAWLKLLISWKFHRINYTLYDIFFIQVFELISYTCSLGSFIDLFLSTACRPHLTHATSPQATTRGVQLRSAPLPRASVNSKASKESIAQQMSVNPTRGAE